MSYFADTINDVDRKMLSLSSGPSSAHQQALEALALLVALREWRSHWQHRRACLSVQTDYIAPLSMITKMQPHSDTLGVIAREIALDVAPRHIVRTTRGIYQVSPTQRRIT